MRPHVMPTLAVVAVVVVGMVFSIWWDPVVHHTASWVTPGDVWGTFRDAHLVAWGGEGTLYASNVQPLTGYISLPAMPVVLAPFAVLSGALHLTESLPLALGRPSAWLLLGPVEMAAGASALFPLDAVARRLGIGPRRRAVLVWAEAALFWPVIALWGHPEDLIALGMGAYALIAVQEHRWRRAGILFGVALAFQPLVVLLLPLVAAAIPWRRLAPFAGLVVAPAALLLVAPLAHAWGTTLHALVDQPTYPAVNHPTPWLALSSVLSRPAHVRSAGHASLGAVGAASAHAGPVVAGGPVRLIPVILSVLAALYVVRRRPPEREVWFLAGVLLASRCAFEAVMTPYYAVPALAMALIVAEASNRWRLMAAIGCAGVCTYLGYRHAGPWAYDLPVTGTLMLTVLVGRVRPRLLIDRLVRHGAPTDADATPGRQPVVA